LQHHINYTRFPENEEAVSRTFRLAKSDWTKLTQIRDELLSKHGFKLSLNATLVHLLHQYDKPKGLASGSANE
jgi:hypothetical protein